MLHISKVFHINDMDGSCNNFGSKKKKKKKGVLVPFTNALDRNTGTF